MQRIVNKAKNFKEAEEWDIQQIVSLTPVERQKIAKKLKDRFYKDKRIHLKEYAGQK